MKDPICIWWMRRDLRIEDNAALYHALTSGFKVLPVFIFDKNILQDLVDKKDKRIQFIHDTLTQVEYRLQEWDSAIYYDYDIPLHSFLQLKEKFDIKAVYTNTDYEPYASKRDQEIKLFLQQHAISFYSFKDQVLFEKSEILKADHTPYKVFTPYSRIWKMKFLTESQKAFDCKPLYQHFLKIKAFPMPSLKELGFEKVDFALPKIQLNKSFLHDYDKVRDIPWVEGTSHISLYLRFGLMSIRELVSQTAAASSSFLNELIWREFFMMILFQYPRVAYENFQQKYDTIQWRNNTSEFEKWCKGETGFPLVDAGMRQLNETGYMHNRVRMVTASFLTKHLLIDWQWGEAYFAQKLLDYELSSNNGNWQWAAGTGCDAAPYFRIFNPETQIQKFDPQLKYIKKWIPDFSLGYAKPIVDHAFARNRALSVYKKALEESTQLR